MYRIPALLLALLAIAHSAFAFEVKGLEPGADVSSLDVAGCEQVSNADSGIPGLKCGTTVGGDQAEARISVFNGKVVDIVLNIRHGFMRPVLDALTEKYGHPSKRNRYIEDYSWSDGGQQMNIKENRVRGGYTILIVDWPLFKAARNAAKDKAKGDI